MKSGTYNVKHVAILGHPRITSVRQLRALMKDQPTDVLVHTRNNGKPIFLAGNHVDADKVVLVGKGPYEGISAVLQHAGLLRRLKLVVG